MRPALMRLSTDPFVFLLLLGIFALHGCAEKTVFDLPPKPADTAIDGAADVIPVGPTSCTDDAACSPLNTPGSCERWVCDLTTTQCQSELLPYGTPCGVPNDCVIGVCTGGVCVTEAFLSCDDANPCTDDHCNENQQCEHTPNTSACDPGNPCAPTGICTDGICAIADYICPPCTKNKDCDEINQGDKCTGSYTCTLSTSYCERVPESITLCTTTNPCVSAFCDPNTGECQEDPRPNGWACADGNLCSLEDQCLNGQCTGTPLQCPQGQNACTSSVCHQTTGCQAIALDGQPCNDASTCTISDACDKGICIGEPTAECACNSNDQCSDFDDDNGCNGVLICVNGACKPDPNSLVVCEQPSSPCRIAICIPETGTCVETNGPDIPCSDGDKCTAEDHCIDGQCQGSAGSCSDLNPCTTDDCDPALGCQFQPIPDCSETCANPDLKQCDPDDTQACEFCGTTTCTNSCSWGPCQDGGVCAPGATQACGSDGIETCTNACTWGPCEEGECVNGVTDPCGNCGVQTCTNKTWGSCQTEGVCTPGATQPCGNDGTQTCSGSCAWGECQGQAPCSAGETQPCGDCGTQTCGGDKLWGPCTGAGPCTPEQTESQSCGNCGTEARTCTEQCQWEGWEGCQNQGVCVAGSTTSQGCGNCGTETKTCTDQCQWGNWENCQNQGVCTPNTSQPCGSNGTETCASDCQWGECTGQGPCFAGQTQGCGNCGTQTCGGDNQWGECTATGPCTEGQKQTQGCGFCGTTLRTCSALCQWGDWATCLNQGVCSPAELKSKNCGNCGTKIKTCSSSCEWGLLGKCQGEGACKPGDQDSQSCGNCGSQTRTCKDQCQWGSYGSCDDQGECASNSSIPCGLCGVKTCNSSCAYETCSDEGVCTPGQTETQACGSCGTQTRTCTSSCSWGNWGSCDGEGVCEPDSTNGCGNCGTKTCNNSCAWGSCGGEGVCTKGTTDDCGNCGTKTCNSSCAWGSCDGQGVCKPGDQDSQDCGDCGSQSKTCGGSCQWGDYGSCDGQGVCTKAPPRTVGIAAHKHATTPAHGEAVAVKAYACPILGRPQAADPAKKRAVRPIVLGRPFAFLTRKASVMWVIRKNVILLAFRNVKRSFRTSVNGVGATRSFKPWCYCVVVDDFVGTSGGNASNSSTFFKLSWHCASVYCSKPS